MHVRKVLKVLSVDQGCTCPAEVTLDNEEKAFFKYWGNPQGNIVLFNEYFSNRIAKEVDLTIPGFGLATVDESVIIEEGAKERFKIDGNKGVGFYSISIPTAVKASPRLVCEISNLHEFCRSCLVDAIVNDGDRHNTNSIISLKNTEHELYYIDRSHAFGDPDWDVDTLRIGDYESPFFWHNNKPYYDMMINAGADLSFDQLMREKDFIQSRITDQVLQGIINELPKVWVDELGSKKISHAKEYVFKRVQNLETICEMILKESGV